jgi:hypothetical protein
LRAGILFNRWVTSEYRLAPAISARLIGASVVVLALVALLTTALVLAFGWPIIVLWIATGMGALGVARAAWYLTHASVVTLSETGYRVRFLRGSGVVQGRWVDVEDAVSAKVGGAVCLVLRLRDGRSTVIPVVALAGHRDDFAEAVRKHLAEGNGLRPLS